MNESFSIRHFPEKNICFLFTAVEKGKLLSKMLSAFSATKYSKCFFFSVFAHIK